VVPWLQSVIVADHLQPLEALLARLSPEEREQAEGKGFDEHATRQWVLGRLAAHAAVRRVLGREAPSTRFEILTGVRGAPLVWADGRTDVVSVAIAHSGRLAAACAWRGGHGDARSAGVDVERLRRTELAANPYAFSRRERRLIAQAPHEPYVAALAAWTVKEAAWKALRPETRSDPTEIRLKALSLTRGWAAVDAGDAIRRRWGKCEITVCVGSVSGPDGPYFLSLAVISPKV
jgi:4'-phosphopantetheinyl transferase EntD